MASGTWKRWNGSGFVASGTWRRWNGTIFEPERTTYPAMSPSPSSVLVDFSGTDAVTVAFKMVVAPTDGGVHMFMEHSTNVNDHGGFFMLTESEFGVPNALEFCSKAQGVSYDIVTCPRPTANVLHRVVWVMDRAFFPCHKVWIDGVAQPITPAGSGYSSPQNGIMFSSDMLYLLSRAGNQIIASGQVSTPPLTYRYAMADADALALSGVN